MSVSRFSRFWLSCAILCDCATGRPSTRRKVSRSTAAPIRTRSIRDWGKLPDRPWGGSNGVAIDRDGKSVWAVDRCSPGTAPGLSGHQGRTRFTSSMSPARKSEALAAACSCGRTACTSTATETSGWPTRGHPSAEDARRSFPAKKTRAASSSSSAPRARC